MTKINLLPPELKRQSQTAKQNLSVFLACLTILIVAIILAVVFSAVSTTLEYSLNNLKKSIQSSETSLESYRVLKDQLLFINDRLKELNNLEKKQLSWSVLLEDLAKATPEGIKITSLNFDPKGKTSLKISGEASSQAEIVNFQMLLESSNFFSETQLESSEILTKEGKEILNFNLNGKLEK